ncbi:hypothetical protein TNCV_2247711 [Trichonephila clavipes]|nr:hypothetical protein TNCV_2247711 [Trichonephila clavipes]
MSSIRHTAYIVDRQAQPKLCSVCLRKLRISKECGCVPSSLQSPVDKVVFLRGLLSANGMPDNAEGQSKVRKRLMIQLGAGTFNNKLKCQTFGHQVINLDLASQYFRTIEFKDDNVVHSSIWSLSMDSAESQRIQAEVSFSRNL